MKQRNQACHGEQAWPWPRADRVRYSAGTGCLLALLLFLVLNPFVWFVLLADPIEAMDTDDLQSHLISYADALLSSDCPVGSHFSAQDERFASIKPADTNILDRLDGIERISETTVRFTYRHWFRRKGWTVTLTPAGFVVDDL